MRLTRLELAAFGGFEDVVLDFSSPKVHVVFGANESGKSTTRRAIFALLFGVPRGSRDAYLVGKATQLRVGGTLVGRDGRELTFVRRGGMRDTLVDRNGSVVADDALDAMRGALDATTFDSVFTMDHASLERGAEAVLDARGELGETLAAAALGSARLSAAKVALGEQERALYNPAPQAKSSELHTAIRTYKERHDALEQAESSPEAYFAQERALEEARASHVALVAEGANLRRALSELEEADAARPALATLAKVRARLAELGDVAPLPRSAEVDHTRASSDKRAAELALRALTEEVRELDAREARRATELVPEDVELEATDLEKRRADRALGEARRRTLLEERADLSTKLAEATLRSAATDLGRARACLARRGEIADRAEATADARRRRDEAARRANRAAHDLELAPPSDTEKLASDLAPLEALAPHDDIARAATRAALDTGARASAANERVATLGRALFVTVPSFEELVSTTLPSRERLAELLDERARLRGELSRISGERRSTEAQIARIHNEIEHLRLASSGPTEADLGDARRARDELVARVAQEPIVLGAARVAVRKADEIADALRRDADAARRTATLTSELSALVARRDTIMGEESRASDALAFACSLELDEARRLGARIADVEGLPQLRARLDALVDAMRERDEADAAERHAKEAEESLARLYAERLAEPEGRTLTALTVIATERRDKLRKALAEAKGRSDTRERLEGELAAATSALAAAEDDLRVSAARIEDDLRALGLDHDAPPGDVRARLEGLAEVYRLEEAITRIDAVLLELGRERDDFEGYVAAFAARLGEPPAVASADALAEAVLGRITASKRAREAARHDREARDHKSRERVRHEAALREAKERLDALHALAGTSDDAAFVQAVRAADEHTALSKRRDELEEEVTRTCRRTEREVVERIVAETQPSELHARLAELEVELGRNDIETKRALEATVRNEKGLDDMRRHDLGASVRAEEAESALATIVHKAEEWLVARAARRLLERRIEAFRSESQGPVVSRASEHFRAMTRGAYERLEVAFDDLSGTTKAARADRGSGLVMHAVKASEGPGPSSVLGVDELSTGTRDQLYLALRLASLERLVDLGTVAPIVLDDALVHFDDDRARAAFTRLAPLASRATVLFFTHHARMCELAREALGDEVVVTALR
ncbi:MAG: AAA family ATPase [Myxococcales bacterium]|nr:AAA family ATPase [Myxococcales bacterium]